MTNPIVVLGAGGFGRETLDVITAINAAAASPEWEFLGFFDDGDPDLAKLERLGARFLGPLDRMPEYKDSSFVVGIGDPQVRMRVADRAEAAGLLAATLIHPTATIGSDSTIGPGSIVCSHVSITTNIRVGSHVHLNLNTTVGHDCVLEDFCVVNPGATVSGNVRLGRGSTLGTNATAIQGVTIGSLVMVGAGAAVVRDVRSEVTVVGVPAKEIGSP